MATEEPARLCLLPAQAPATGVQVPYALGLVVHGAPIAETPGLPRGAHSLYRRKGKEPRQPRMSGERWRGKEERGVKQQVMMSSSGERETRQKQKPTGKSREKPASQRQGSRRSATGGKGGGMFFAG